MFHCQDGRCGHGRQKNRPPRTQTATVPERELQRNAARRKGREKNSDSDPASEEPADSPPDNKRKLKESDITGLKYFDKLAPLLERLHDDACERDKAGNRELHFDQYCLLILLYRPDRCDRELTTPICEHAARFLSTVPVGDIVLFSDYGKGVCTSTLLTRLGNRARDTGVPILVDPARDRNWSDYGQVALIKANWVEARETANCENPRPLMLARDLSEQHSCDVVVTLGCHGMVCAERPAAVRYLPAIPAELRDVCGAGDTVLATLGVAIARGAPLREACALAVKAAAEQVSRFGIAPIRGAA